MTARRAYVGVAVVVGLVALGVLWSLFRPELLFVNATVDEAPPVAASAPIAATGARETVQPTSAAMSSSEMNETTQPTAAVVNGAMEPTGAAMSSNEAMEHPTAAAVEVPTAQVAPTAVPAPPIAWSASFQSLAHETQGTADLRTLEDGARVLRLEDFTTSNGPDVRVYLVRGSDATQDKVINDGDFIDLGALKGNIGDQNYPIPADVDLAQYRSVSIWCRRFSVNFGATVLDE